MEVPKCGKYVVRNQPSHVCVLVCLVIIIGKPNRMHVSCVANLE